jgi:undecaprenyl-diphosphatase
VNCETRKLLDTKLLDTKKKLDDNLKNAATKVESVQAATAEQIVTKPTRRWRAQAFQVYLFTATVTFGVLLVLASRINYFPIDLSITHAVQRINLAWFAKLMDAVSLIGYAPQMYVLVAIISALFYIIGLRWEAVMALIASASAGLAGGLIKIIVSRPRPGVDLVNVIRQLNSYSFPSGHVLTYAAFFGFLFFLVFTLIKRSYGRTIILVVLGSMVTLIGVSRIYVGVHWFSDVTGAYLLGSLWLVLLVRLYRWGKKRFFVRQPLAPEKSESSASKS